MPGSGDVKAGFRSGAPTTNGKPVAKSPLGRLFERNLEPRYTDQEVSYLWPAALSWLSIRCSSYGFATS